MSAQDTIDVVLRQTQPLKFPRGDRLPLLVWTVMGVGTDDDAKAEQTLKDLDARGIPVLESWRPNPKYRDRSLAAALRVAKLQKKLGLQVVVNANSCMHSFCDGSNETAHFDAEGKPFFDTSFAKRRKMGCPFRLKHRYPAIKEQLEFFLKAYKKAGVDIDMIFLDWEIDGPIEWNDAWAHSKRCKVCREHIPNIDDFRAFQKALRTIRCDIQREVFCNTVKAYFPNALIGNYSVTPHDGYRYWYDYYEKLPQGAPFVADGNAKYREWFHEFEPCGYTMAMPTVYPWCWTWHWYDFDVGDYRWFYNMLKVATNSCRHTPAAVPVVPFVHWETVWCAPKEAAIQQQSERSYKELLWHMLLRGSDTLFLWCPRSTTAMEVKPLHEVYAASLEYKDFLDKGEPVCFDVPTRPATVVSGLRLGEQVLVRRTDFAPTDAPVSIAIPGRGILAVPKVEGRCQILALPPK